MDFRGQAVAGIWLGAALIIAILLYFGATGELIVLFLLALIGLTVYVVQQRPEKAAELANAGRAPG
jgi:hypothetical protein